MDIPRYLATHIHNISDLRAEAEPSPADIGPEHFIVSATSFWEEPNGTYNNFDTGNFSFEENGIPVEGYDQALPVRVVWKSKGSGEAWRGVQIERTRLNTIMFSAPFLLPVMGGRLYGRAAELADDGQGVDIADFDEVNLDGPGLGMYVGLKRDPSSDVMFKRDTRSHTRMGKTQETHSGYIVEQHFIGHVFFNGGAEVRERRT